MKYVTAMIIGLLLISGCTTPKRSTHKCTPDDMDKLGILAAQGDRAAIDELENIAQELYSNINPDAEHARMLSNLRLMRAAFNPIGTMAGEGSETAFDALVYANSKARLRSFTADAFGIAAGMGNTNALNYLLHCKENGFLLASTVFALQPAAKQNIPEAVDFLIKVIENPSHKPLWHGAAQGLAGAASQGNKKAEDALNKYAEEFRHH